MSQYDTTFDLKINVVAVTYILWSSDFALYMYLEDYDMNTILWNLSWYDPVFDLK